MLLCPNERWHARVNPLSLAQSAGSYLTPAHHYGDFRFKTYAPMAFRYFREMFGIRPDDYMVCLASGVGENAREVSGGVKLGQNGVNGVIGN